MSPVREPPARSRRGPMETRFPWWLLVGVWIVPAGQRDADVRRVPVTAVRKVDVVVKNGAVFDPSRIYRALGLRRR